MIWIILTTLVLIVVSMGYHISWGKTKKYFSRFLFILWIVLLTLVKLMLTIEIDMSNAMFVWFWLFWLLNMIKIRANVKSMKDLSFLIIVFWIAISGWILENIMIISWINLGLMFLSLLFVWDWKNNNN